MSEVERGPASDNWRQGAPAVVVLAVEVDGEAALTGLSAQPDTGDLTAMSHQAYGPRVGLPRILQLIGQLQIPATFFVPGSVAERWPKAVEGIVLAGHEVALHGHAHRALTELTPDQQSEDFERARQALGTLGITPAGFRAPFNRLTRHTLDLVAQHGLQYDSSLMDDDRPYRLRAAQHAIAELPISWTLDDTVPYAIEPELPEAAANQWKHELDAMRASGGLCVLTVHDFLSGRPSRLRALQDFLTHAREQGVRFSRADELARAVLGR